MRNTKLLLLFSIAIMASCKKEEKPDPCLNYYNQKGFDIYDFGSMSNIFLKWPDDNETSNWRDFKFEAVNEYQEYFWRVGLEDKDRLGKSIIVTSLRNDPGSDYTTIRLIGKRTPKPECKPDDEGIDTFYRKIYITPRNSLDKSISTGYFQGSFSFDKQDTFTLGIFLLPLTDPKDSAYFLSGYPNGYIDPNLNYSVMNFYHHASWIRNNILMTTRGLLYENCNCNFHPIKVYDDMRKGACLVADSEFRGRLENKDELIIWANLKISSFAGDNPPVFTEWRGKRIK